MTDLSPSLRPALDADRTFLWDLRVETMRPLIDRIWGWDEAWQRGRFEDDLASLDVRIIDAAGQRAGSIWLRGAGDQVYIAEFQVLPRLQGRGIGTAVLSDVVSRARSEGRCTDLAVFAINARARALYERLGFYVRSHEGEFFQMRRLPAWPADLRTPRVLLRRWRGDDREAFARMNADPRVMEFFPTTMTRQESDEGIDRMCEAIDARGFSFWAVELPGVAPLAGFLGLSVPRFEVPFTPCVEIGWRLLPEFWNQGYATEGARAALAFGFDTLELDEIVAFTVPGNARSRRVMEKLGMTYDPADDFDTPRLPAGHPMRRHVLYRIRQKAWRLGG